MAEKNKAEAPKENTDVQGIASLLTNLQKAVESRVEADIKTAQTACVEAYIKLLDPQTKTIPLVKLAELYPLLQKSINVGTVRALIDGLTQRGIVNEQLNQLMKQMPADPNAKLKPVSQSDQIKAKVMEIVGGFFGEGGDGKNKSELVEKMKSFGVTKEVVASGILTMLAGFLEGFGAMIPMAAQIAADIRYNQLEAEVLADSRLDEEEKPEKIAQLKTPKARKNYDLAYRQWVRNGKDPAQTPGYEAALTEQTPAVSASKEAPAPATAPKETAIDQSKDIKITSQGTDVLSIKPTPGKIELSHNGKSFTVGKIDNKDVSKVAVIDATDKDPAVVVFILGDGTKIFSGSLAIATKFKDPNFDKKLAGKVGASNDITVTFDVIPVQTA